LGSRRDAESFMDLFLSLRIARLKALAFCNKICSENNRAVRGIPRDSSLIIRLKLRGR
jgi:hypothetical protein